MDRIWCSRWTGFGVHDGPDSAFTMARKMHDSFGIAVLGRLPDFGHADLRADALQARRIVKGRILQPLIRVVNFWATLGERQFQRAERQFDAKTKAELPAAHDSGEDIHDHRQVDELFAQPNVCDVRDPNLIRACDLQIGDQIRIARERMFTIGGLDRPPFDTAIDLLFAHHTLYPLAVDLQLVGWSPQLRGQPS